MGHPALNGIREITGIFENKSKVENFIESGVLVTAPSGGLMPLKLYPDQKKMIKHMEGNDRSAIIAPRQVGLTTAVLAFLLYEAVTKSNQCIVITSSNDLSSKQNIQTFRRMLDYRVSKRNIHASKNCIGLSNNTTIRAVESDIGFRGLSMTHVFHDNFLSDNRGEEKMKAYYPMLSTKAKYIIGTIPNDQKRMSKIINSNSIKSLLL